MRLSDYQNIFTILNSKKPPKPISNDKIPYPVFIVIDQTGKNLGRLSKSEALAKAHALGLDLILLSDNAQNPVCRLIDLSKYLYEQQKALKKATKKSNLNVIKEVRFFAQIAENDLELRLKRTIQFLQKGHTVRVRMFLRGREKYIKDFGLAKFNAFVEAVTQFGVEDKPWQRKGNAYFIQFKPLKKQLLPKNKPSKMRKSRIK